MKDGTMGAEGQGVWNQSRGDQDKLMVRKDLLRSLYPDN